MRLRVLRRNPSGELEHVCDHKAFAGDGSGPSRRFIGAYMLKNCREELAERGFHLVSPGEDYDLSLMEHSQVTQEVIDRGFPLVIHDTRDTGMIMESERPYVLAPNVVGYVKSAVYRDLNLYNAEIQGPTYHDHLSWVSLSSWLRAEIPRRRPQPQLPLEILDRKLRCTIGFAHMEFFDRLCAEPPLDFGAYRQIDCFFAGNMYYSRPAVALHRWQCFKELDTNPAFAGRYVEAHPGRVVNYFARMRNAKCVVSPWGYGERDFVDIAAILCGAVLIKPETGWSQSMPDIHADGRYIPCLPNFSDLSDKVSMVCQEWGQHLGWIERMRRISHDLILNSRRPLRVIGHFIELFDYYRERL